MTKKRGRPKKLPSLEIKDFDRQFREACIPALLVDREFTVLYANEYARTSLPEAHRPEALRALLPEDSREECVRRVASGECFRLALPSVGGASFTLVVTPVAAGDGGAAGAMVFLTSPPLSAEQTASRSGLAALSGGLRQPISDIFSALALINRELLEQEIDRQLAEKNGPEARQKSGKCQQYLESINQSSYQLLRNISNLVSYQRSCSGFRGTMEVVDFWGRLAPILDACGIVLHNNKIPFRFEIPDQRNLVHVSCCFSEVEDALMNLISNAYRHTRPGNRVEVIGKNIKNAVVVTVSDCGRGIEPDQLDKIFSPFYSRGQDGEAFVGMGIGLTVARQNILRSGGTLAVDSTPGKGTSIAFTLPTCDRPLTPSLAMASISSYYLQDRFSKIYIGLCNEATLPPQ